MMDTTTTIDTGLTTADVHAIKRVLLVKVEKEAGGLEIPGVAMTCAHLIASFKQLDNEAFIRSEAESLAKSQMSLTNTQQSIASPSE